MASLNTIIDWYRDLPKPVRERMSLENLHDLSKRLDRKHVYWMPGEPDCPRAILAGNGELHTLRCKACGLDRPRNKICTPIAAVAAALDERLKQHCLDRDSIDTAELAEIALAAAEPTGSENDENRNAS